MDHVFERISGQAMTLQNGDKRGHWAVRHGHS
jgi:hypothetical protein